MSVEKNDWRRMGQESFLRPGTRFVLKRYRAYSETWEHDHCAMCTVKFMDPSSAAAMASPMSDVAVEGYATTSEFERGADYEWVCCNCFADFGEEFGWLTAEAD